MVQNDLLSQYTDEPPRLGESWWKDALREADQDPLSAYEPSENGYHDLDSPPLESEQARNDWDTIRNIYENDKIVTLKVVGCNKGGLLVQGEHLNGFVPTSHLVQGDHREKQDYLGGSLSLKVIEFDKKRSRVVLSERAAQSAPGQRLKLLDTLEEGDCVQGVVTTITSFGVFVDLGGVEGLIHISELSWGRVEHPSEIVSIGEEVEVYVLSVDRQNSKVALSLKSLCSNPWETITDRYQPGQVVEAVVKNIVSYGAFVQLEEGVDGLIHISEFGDNGDDVSPWDVLEEDQVVEARIIHLDPEGQRLGLSLISGDKEA
ncbi:MAG: S1 RNA-binding domain-containing protein [Anaerolineales bacterium]